MFTRIDMLPLNDANERDRARSRWERAENIAQSEMIKEMIRAGAGEHFLEQDYQHGDLPMLWDEADLRGIMLHGEEISFPTADNFCGESFAYQGRLHCTFRNAYFSGDFSFADFYNCTFIGCTFGYCSFYGSTFENSRFLSCDFVNNARFTNTDMQATKLRTCFFAGRVFRDCCFDERTTVDLPLINAPHNKWPGVHLAEHDIAEFYKGCREGYAAGEVTRLVRRFAVYEKQAITRHNTSGWLARLSGLLLEVSTGYGFAPSRIVATMAVAFLLLSILPISKLGFWDGLLLSAGAFFTFGANSDKTVLLGNFGKTLYIVEPFVGVCLVALLVTMLARYWFQDR